MADYRLYCVTGDGRVRLADWIIARSDEEAIAGARALRADARERELWLKARLVARTNARNRFERVPAERCEAEQGPGAGGAPKRMREPRRR